MRVLKFGGSSLATSDRVRDVVRIVLDEARKEPLIVVVSAFQGITNQLIDCARLAERGEARYEQEWAAIARRHRSAIDDLVGPRRGRRTRVVDVDLGADAHFEARLVDEAPFSCSVTVPREPSMSWRVLANASRRSSWLPTSSASIRPGSRTLEHS